MTLQVASPEKKGVYQASKWLKWQVLCSEEELRTLFEMLKPFWLFHLTGIVDGKPMAPEVFLAEYGRWIEKLKQGQVPTEEEQRRLLACAFTDDLESLWLQDVKKGYLVKVAKPVMQVQSHFFSYSEVDQTFRPMSMGVQSIFWGLQFSWPQIYQDPHTMEICETKMHRLPKALQVWVREWTRPTPFVVGGKKINSPIRLGKGCFSWIHHHPELKEQGIGIHA